MLTSHRSGSGQDTQQFLESVIREDSKQGLFKVHRGVFTDHDILRLEQRLIFQHTWLYLGHTSEVVKPNDFITRKVAGHPLLLTRDRDGHLHAYFVSARP